MQSVSPSRIIGLVLSIILISWQVTLVQGEVERGSSTEEIFFALLGSSIWWIVVYIIFHPWKSRKNPLGAQKKKSPIPSDATELKSGKSKNNVLFSAKTFLLSLARSIRQKVRSKGIRYGISILILIVFVIIAGSLAIARPWRPEPHRLDCFGKLKNQVYSSNGTIILSCADPHFLITCDLRSLKRESQVVSCTTFEGVKYEFRQKQRSYYSQ